MKEFITIANIIVSLLVWYPAFRKMYTTKRAGDYSLLTMGLILYLQCGNITLAIIEHSWSLLSYFIANLLIVGAVTWYIKRLQCVDAKSQTDLKIS